VAALLNGSGAKIHHDEKSAQVEQRVEDVRDEFSRIPQQLARYPQALVS